MPSVASRRRAACRRAAHASCRWFSPSQPRRRRQLCRRRLFAASFSSFHFHTGMGIRQGINVSGEVEAQKRVQVAEEGACGGIP